ncbi:MAG: rRNA pseudouridine synthase [Acidobacteria bacterium]|nr:rRNA pseudouridine synthase [Acidobacteriota bacterium]
MPEERLQKIISRAGITSRRKAEELITTGMVKVNGKVVTELGTKADLDRDHIKVNGKLIHAPRNLVYLAFHKPRECVTTVSDPEGRTTVMEYIRGVKERVYPVGRLDYESEGLLLLTNDGEFANRITHAKNQVPKTYVVKATGALSQEQEQAFREGIYLHGKRTAPAGLKLLQRSTNPWYEVKLVEGRQNQIRLMFRHFGFLVEKLKRTRIGFLDLGRLKAGEFRHLTPLEVGRFRRTLRMDSGEKGRA